jgi:hypothetical protein
VLLGSSALEDGSRFGLNVVFAHEAYRNGIDDGEAGQMLETTRAVMGHIDTAMGLMQSYGQGVIGEALAGEALGFYNNLAILTSDSSVADREAAFAGILGTLGSYDIGADYFRMYKDSNGQVTRVLDDGDIYHVTIVDSDGSERTVTLQSGSISAALAAAAGNGMTKQQMNDLMIESGLWYEEGRSWYAREERGRYVPDLAVEMETGNSSPDSLRGLLSHIDEVVRRGVTGLRNAFDSLSESIKKGIESLLARFSNPEQPQARENQDSQDSYMSVPGGDSLSFYQKIMNSATAEQYSYAQNNLYMCNTYVRSMIMQEYGSDVYNLIFQGKDENTNAMFDSFRNNPNLERLDPQVYSISAIQNMADSGNLILMIYKNLTPGASGHIAFVGNSKLTMSTVPAINGLEGRTGSQVLGPDQLVLVQAGTYTGNTLINYGTNGWRIPEERASLLMNNLYFYALKRR